MQSMRKNSIKVTVDNNGTIQHYKGESMALLMFTQLDQGIGIHFAGAADEMMDLWQGIIYQAVESLGLSDVFILASNADQSKKKGREIHGGRNSKH